jgi:hypothetical protein
MRFVVKTMSVLILAVMFLSATLWATSLMLEPNPAGPAQAPSPNEHRDAIIQVYGANVWGFRGKFAIHTWLATKAKDAKTYTIYQVIGWRLRRGRSVVSVSEGNPATPWYGSKPILLHELNGKRAQSLIDEIHDAALSYPFADEYKMWPGPNSNSFTAWIGLEVPEMRLSLPAKAIGKSWMIDTYPVLKSMPRMK